MHSTRSDFPAEWDHANIYTLADLHIGDPAARAAEINRRIREIEDDECGLCVLNGDLINVALRNSVSDVYGEKLSTMRQITYLCELVAPIKNKVIAVTTGNHEWRGYKTDGVDFTRLVCRELGIEDKYDPAGVVVFLRFGLKRAKDRKTTWANNSQRYTIYATHGSGGGRKEGAKAIRLADMASIVDADIYIHSHTHLPMVMKEAYYRTDPCNSTVKRVERLFVNTGAALGYGGYGQMGEFKPASAQTPVIHLDAARKRAAATL